MSNQRFETGKAPEIIITQASGDLVAKGWMGSAVEVTGQSFSAEMSEQDRIVISVDSDAELLLPPAASLKVDRIEGPISVKHLNGSVIIGESKGKVTLQDVDSIDVGICSSLTAENVSGNLRIGETQGLVLLRNVRSVHIDRCGQSVTASYVNGVVEILDVAGSVEMHTVNGALTIRQVKGDVQLSNLGDVNDVSGVDGQIRLVGGLMSGEHYFAADGDIIVRWPADAPLSLTAIAPTVHSKLPLENEIESHKDEQTVLTGHIEEGKARLTLKTGARIGLTPTYERESGPPSPADFEFNFSLKAVESKSSVVDETRMADSPGSPESEDPVERLAASIMAAIVRQLTQKTFQVDLEMLEALVQAAVLEGLGGDALSVSSKAETAPLADVPTIGMLRANRARRAVERSLQQAQEQIESAKRKSHSTKGRPASATDTSSADKAEAATEPADVQQTTEERRQILQLLRDGHISVQQATTLLDALSS